MDELADTGMRRIRNIDFCSQEFETLLPGSTQKISGTTLDAFGAIMQDTSSRSPQGCNYSILSSWIPAIVSGRERSGGYAGTVEDHVLVACKDQNPANLLCSQGRWAIPICGGNPAHWVLGWVEWPFNKYGIVDSIPELESASWAVPLLRDSADRVRLAASAEVADWTTMAFSLCSPDASEQQIDGWSCGLFVMMALKSFAKDWQEPIGGQSLKDSVRAEALRVLLAAPARPPRSTGVHRAAGQDQGRNASVKTVSRLVQTTLVGSGLASSSKKRTLSVTDLESDSLKNARARQSKQPCLGPDKSETTTRHQHRSRQPRQHESAREAKLSGDEWAYQVEPHRVQCAGCRQWINLHKKRRFDLQNWYKHKQRCSHITGVEHVRVTKLEDGKIGYNMIAVAATRSVREFFPVVTAEASQSASSQPPRLRVPTPILVETPCRHLQGEPYTEYIIRTHTRSLGGISPSWRSRIARQLFPYKPLQHTQQSDAARLSQLDRRVASTAEELTQTQPPPDSNLECEERNWTKREQLALDHALSGWARWIVDYGRRLVKSTRCEGTTMNASGVCNACQALQEDDAFKRAVARKNKEAQLSEDKQREIIVRREKYAPTTLRTAEARDLQLKMSDTTIFKLVQALERGDSIRAFLALYQRAKEGKLTKYQTFVDICAVLEKQLSLAESDSPGAKKGIRYPQDYLNFMTIMRSYGQHSAQQYGILTSQIGGPCPRSLQKVVKRSPDVLSKPDLDFDNVARVKRLMDSLKYRGPVAVAGDCTKVRQRLSYSNDHGSHILGSTLSLDDCVIDEVDDITRIVARVRSEKKFASQVRAILVKIPLPQIPPLVVALRPTKGDDDAASIYALHVRLLKMAEQLGIKIISLSADGASSEQGAQSLMDARQSSQPPLVYTYPLYGISLYAPVFPTGPLISCQDPQHARKTCRNQPQHGTHTASLGRGVVVNRCLVDLQETGASGLMRRDVENVDKQDDGAARRLFHYTALEAMTTQDAAGCTYVRDEFLGLFVYLFIFGELFDAWLNRRLAIHERVCAALRARAFLHIWYSHIKQMERRFPDLYRPHRAFISPASFNIFNRLCDTLVLLALAYSMFYPDEPFCPWLLGTEFIEHFFGLARTLLPDFTYVELLKLVKHVMLRQQILLSGKVAAKKERTSRAGYVLDYDPTPLTAAELENARVSLSEASVNRLVELAHKEATQIAKQLLRLPIPALPFSQIPLRPPPTSKRSHRARAPPASEDDDEEDDDDVQINDDDDDDDDEELDGDLRVEDGLSEASGVDVSALSSAEANASLDNPALMAQLAKRTAEAAHYTARLSALSEDLDSTLDELTEEELAHLEREVREPGPFTQPLPSPPLAGLHTVTLNSSPLVFVSKILDLDNKVVIQQMLDLRREHQSSTSTHSERVVKVDPKFALSRLEHPEKKMSIREASHLLRVAQDLAGPPMDRLKSTREQRWQEVARKVQEVVKEQDLPNLPSKNVTAVNPLRPGSFVIMKNDRRTYLGEVLDLYKKTKNRHGSLDVAATVAGLSYLSLRVYLPLSTANMMDGDAPSDSSDEEYHDHDGAGDATSLAPPFSCRNCNVDIHTHAPADQLLYHLGLNAASGPRHSLIMKAFAASRWSALTRRKVQEKLVIRIPARPVDSAPTANDTSST
ncbi:hypothetical protein PYCCODRAFT_1396354 [Trametes coccinea BRFM310]|uniref:Ubiquitin-like protease family profile domain-containing protein n=1 Tax=Trametes coccinea (strain BRFM310) TaxID=1353009 RepID=A0A1Y2IG75_TRAC3|nr:hypothetical protein PYCCODRAFT_1396354 [Trametes coccinea BRFM310]